MEIDSIIKISKFIQGTIQIFCKNFLFKFEGFIMLTRLYKNKEELLCIKN